MRASLSGELPYQLSLVLDGVDSQLRVDSDLKGLAVTLPAPFGKAAEETRPTSYRMTLQGNERRYWLDYAKLASLALAAPPGELLQGRGTLRFGNIVHDVEEQLVIGAIECVSRETGESVIQGESAGTDPGTIAKRRNFQP